MTNIIFILIDALRKKNLGCYGYVKPTSPNIDSLSKKSIIFENAFSTSSATDSSLTSIFSGLYPFNHGIKNNKGKFLNKGFFTSPIKTPSKNSFSESKLR